MTKKRDGMEAEIEKIKEGRWVLRKGGGNLPH
jgi:hypothetical protein